MLRFSNVRAQPGSSTPARVPLHAAARARMCSAIAAAPCMRERPLRRAATRGAAGRSAAPATHSTRWSVSSICSGRASRCASRSNPGKPHSMILWGPPGVGKTTLARLMAQAFDARIHRAVGGVLRRQGHPRGGGAAETSWRDQGRRTILFVDEVHRFNKAQQDALSALRRARAVHLHRRDDREPVVRSQSARCCRARRSMCSKPLVEAELGRPARPRGAAGAAPDLEFDAGARERLIGLCRWRCAPPAQPARTDRATAAHTAGIAEVDGDFVERTLAQNLRRFDKGGDAFYDQISALHKSVRGSRPRCGAVLAGAHARRRRRSALPRRGASCAWPARTSAWPTRAPCDSTLRCLRSLRTAGFAGGRAGAGAGGDLPRLRRRRRTRSTSPIMRPAPSSRRTSSRPVPVHLRNAPTQADEGTRLRPRLPLRARRAGSLRGRRALLSRRHGRAELVPADRPRDWKRRSAKSWRAAARAAMRDGAQEVRDR